MAIKKFDNPRANKHTLTQRTEAPQPSPVVPDAVKQQALEVARSTIAAIEAQKFVDSEPFAVPEQSVSSLKSAVESLEHSELAALAALAARLDAEAKLKAEEEAKLKAEEEAKLKAEEEAKLAAAKAEEEAKLAAAKIESEKTEVKEKEKKKKSQ